MSENPHELEQTAGGWWQCVHCSAESTRTEMFDHMDCTAGREVAHSNEE